MSFMKHHRQIIAVLGLLLILDCSNESATNPDTPEPRAPIHYVRSDAPPGGDGSSWAAAFQHPQDALKKASAGDTIWVAKGTYQRPGGKGVVLVMKNSVAIFGGFAGTETARSQRDWTANLTVLDAMGADTVVTGANQARLDGFQVSNSFIGMFNEDLIGLRIENCTFSDNKFAGMQNSNCSPVIINCLFRNNHGGMVNFSGVSLLIKNCIFDGNSADAGGAIAGGLSSAQIINCTFVNNTALGTGNSPQGDGGAILMVGASSSVSMINCLFVGNMASSRGGAVMNITSSIKIINSTFTGNLAESGGAVMNSNSNGTELINCILWGDSASLGSEVFGGLDENQVSYSDIQQAGGFEDLGNNINTGPLFVNPVNMDFHLQTGSPCIDAGTNSEAPDYDREENPRPAGAGFDMGAYEFQP